MINKIIDSVTNLLSKAAANIRMSILLGCLLLALVYLSVQYFTYTGANEKKCQAFIKPYVSQNLAQAKQINDLVSLIIEARKVIEPVMVSMPTSSISETSSFMFASNDTTPKQRYQMNAKKVVSKIDSILWKIKMDSINQISSPKKQ